MKILNFWLKNLNGPHWLSGWSSHLRNSFKTKHLRHAIRSINPSFDVVEGVSWNSFSTRSRFCRLFTSVKCQTAPAVELSVINSFVQKMLQFSAFTSFASTGCKISVKQDIFKIKSDDSTLSCGRVSKTIDQWSWWECPWPGCCHQRCWEDKWCHWERIRGWLWSMSWLLRPRNEYLCAGGMWSFHI